jgi:hypothetical protein
MLMAINKRPSGPDSQRTDVERIVDEILRNRNFICSPEYRLSILDTVCSVALCERVPPRFAIGSIQFDAYNAGLEHGFHTLHEMGLLPGRAHGKRGAR